MKFVRKISFLVIVFGVLIFNTQIAQAEEAETKEIKEYLDAEGQVEVPRIWSMYKYGRGDTVDNLVVLVKSLMGKGFGPQAASAIAGNVDAESGMNPGTLENGLSEEEVIRSNNRGMGYFQWTDHARKGAFLDFMKENGLDWRDREGQIAYFLEETIESTKADGSKGPPTQGEWWSVRNTSYAQYYANWRCEPFSTKEEFLQTTDIERATVVFCRNWERPNAALGHLDRRVEFAEQVYKIIQKFIGTSGFENSFSVKKINKFQKDASVEELQMARGVLMFQNSVLAQVESVNLTAEENINAQQIKDGVLIGNNNTIVKYGRLILSVVGWVIFVWGLLAVVLWVLARKDSLIAQKGIKIVLFGRGTKGLGGLYACIGMMLVGLFVLSGLLFSIIVQIRR